MAINIPGAATGVSGLSFPQAGSSNPMDVLGAIVPLISQLRNQGVANREQEQAYGSNLAFQDSVARARMAKMMQTDQQPNVQFQDNHPDITAAQGQELGIRKSAQDTQNMQLKNTLANTAFNQDIEKKKLDLETLKNKQIYDTKQQDMQRKITESDNKLAEADARLKQNSTNADNIKAYHDAQIASQNARHEADMAAKQNQMDEAQRMHDAQIADLKRKADQAAGSTVSTEVSQYDIAGNPTKKTTTTTRGMPKNRVNVTGPNGETGTIEEGDDLPKGWSLVNQSSMNSSGDNSEDDSSA